MYNAFIRPLLFLLPPEKAHAFTMACLTLFCRVPGGKKILRSLYGVQHEQLRRTLLGITFPNRVGLAAGFDKDARYVDELACLGFGFIEIGTLTPGPQPGNEKPRLFRLPADQALINRMGFNNDGVQAAAERLKRRKSTVIVGGNIGKSKNTPNEDAVHDYLFCLEQLYQWADYFVINVSSPNTPGLRTLQDKEPLTQLLLTLKAWVDKQTIKKPLLLKIAPDLTITQLDDVVEVLRKARINGVVATNTTLNRSGLQTHAARLDAIGTGGISGKPLTHRSTEVIRYLRKQLGPDFTIIGVGGIMTVQDALDKLHAGADLIQLYTGFVYEGPGFVKRIVKALMKKSPD